MIPSSTMVSDMAFYLSFLLKVFSYEFFLYSLVYLIECLEFFFQTMPLLRPSTRSPKVLLFSLYRVAFVQERNIHELEMHYESFFSFGFWREIKIVALCYHGNGSVPCLFKPPYKKILVIEFYASEIH